MLILDFGSGETCDNNKTVIKQMIDQCPKEAVIKWQLFTKKSVDYLPPLKHDNFRIAYDYAAEKGIQTTASVFDYDSLDFLQEFDTPFIKIANRPDLYAMLPDIESPIVSVGSEAFAVEMESRGIPYLCCVSEYPALIKQYKRFHDRLKIGVSDHTEGWYIYTMYKPQLYECHFAISGQAGKEVGAWTRLPENFPSEFQV